MTELNWSDMPPSKRNDILIQRYASLWILPDAKLSDVEPLINFPWINIWNTNPSIDIEQLLSLSSTGRQAVIVESADADVSDFPSDRFVRVYSTTSQKAIRSKTLAHFHSMQLKNRVSDAVGLLIFVGKLDRAGDDLSFIQEVAPQLHLITFRHDTPIAPDSPGQSDIYCFRDSVEFLDTFRSRIDDAPPQSALLRDAEHLSVNVDLLRSLNESWTFLSSDELSARSITQDDFDSFLKGDPIWSIFTADALFHRKLEAKTALSTARQDARTDTLTNFLVDALNELEATGTDPRESLVQFRIFAEPASGLTTCLRQAAIDIAKLGYPVLLTKPNPNRLSSQTMSQFIIDTQDRWRKAKKRSTKGGHGNLPFVLFIDKDLDEEVEHQRFSRGLAGLGREAILVRAFERARDEITKANDILCLRADISEREMLEIGGHLRHFSKRNNLAPMPSDDEWRAYHKGLNAVEHYCSTPGSPNGLERVPHLFLVGLSPFIAERVHGANSLEQYYYAKWTSLPTDNLKQLVRTVAAAGAFGISIPYDATRRVDELNINDFEEISRLSHRTLDVFLHWNNEGRTTKNWYLRIRHPVIGRLLSDAIDPFEGGVPYKALLPILMNLTTKEDDVWFATTLVTKLGQTFKRRAQSFSLETDTPHQRAARAIFDAIPTLLKVTSRAISHHEARYHAHLLHACIDAIKSPHRTTLSKDRVEDILSDEFDSAEGLLKSSLAIDDPHEPEKYILNTRAMLMFTYAEATDNQSVFAERFTKALDVQEKAIGLDATDALARYQFAHEIFQKVKNGPWSDDEKLAFYSRAEVRLQELLRINQERTIKNADPAEAELQIAHVFDLYKEALSAIPNIDKTIDDFRTRNPEAGVTLAIRRLIRASNLRDAFSNPLTADALRDLRGDLELLPEKSVRGLLLLYRLYLDDPEGRLQFEKRLNILVELRRQSANEFLPYWHDEAALLCQLDLLERGADRFSELRAYKRGLRSSQTSQWFWINERALLNLGDRQTLRHLSFIARDVVAGSATISGTKLNIKYQPHQFKEFRAGEVFSACIRFTMAGMQIVPEYLAENDLTAMGVP
ncbi:hypothetical protein DYI24_09535 [Rhodopseudomonas sp. BR0C11]|uniref:hypothetical protein n=1 Tax=Rhodopseudomonas sp. BR0C11 TaxID=2269370 RepID=UPI0013DE9A0C|nr:hypothetical protein [Rhodopseudomonas sp. BR0C11]NEV77283.1 hypothetical protein [Rhodopseudomonas sp. BR0C11]